VHQVTASAVGHPRNVPARFGYGILHVIALLTERLVPIKEVIAVGVDADLVEVAEVFDRLNGPRREIEVLRLS
jgi:hypothetical protein